MICRGLKNHKMTVEDAEKKYQEFLDLDLLDEEHQEVVEELLAEAQEDLTYWSLAKRAALIKDADDEIDENEIIHAEMNEDAADFGSNEEI